MKSKLFIVIVIIIVITGIYLAVKKPSVEAPANQDQTQGSSSENMTSGVEAMINEETENRKQSSIGEKVLKHIVNYTDTGFNPSSLEIKIGQTVQFFNQSKGGMWVASGPHPSHTAYSEFDAKKNIPSGETYEFTFTKIGEWKYHNHTKAEMYGTIIVK